MAWSWPRTRACHYVADCRHGILVSCIVLLRERMGRAHRVRSMFRLFRNRRVVLDRPVVVGASVGIGHAGGGQCCRCPGLACPAGHVVAKSKKKPAGVDLACAQPDVSHAGIFTLSHRGRPDRGVAMRLSEAPESVRRLPGCLLFRVSAPEGCVVARPRRPRARRPGNLERVHGTR